MDKETFATLKNLLLVMEDDIANRGMYADYEEVVEWMEAKAASSQKLEEQILQVLESFDGYCLDDKDERHEVADALFKVFA